MTTIAAMQNKHTGKIVLAHDGRLSTGAGDIISENAKKIIVMEHYVVLWAGSTHLPNLVMHKHKDIFNKLIIENDEDALGFYQIYYDHVLTDATLLISNKEGEKRHSTDFIIVTMDNIYEMNTYGELWHQSMQYENQDNKFRLATGGSGAVSSKAFIDGFIHDSILTTDSSVEIMADIIRRGAEYAADKINTCNKNITIYKIEDLITKPPCSL